MALSEFQPNYLLADKGYDSNVIRSALIEQGIRPVTMTTP
jgi:hypothetical protein